MSSTTVHFDASSVPSGQSGVFRRRIETFVEFVSAKGKVLFAAHESTKTEDDSARKVGRKPVQKPDQNFKFPSTLAELAKLAKREYSVEPMLNALLKESTIQIAGNSLKLGRPTMYGRLTAIATFFGFKTAGKFVHALKAQYGKTI